MVTHMGKVAIITRTKDRPLLLQRTIRSVLDQSHQDWCHVIVNDGGDPTAVEGLVSRFSAEYRNRLLLIHNPSSLGMQNASNKGIQASESEYLVILDDDDSWTPDFLSECVRYLDAAGPDAPEQGVAVQSNWIIEEIDSTGNVVELSRKDYYPFETVTLFLAAGRNPFPPVAFLYRRAVHDRIGFFNQLFNELGDWDFVVRFLSAYEIGVSDKRLANYHWRHQSHGSGYGNTVTDSVASHRRSLARLHNFYLRRDLAEGRMGTGFLFSLATQLETQAGWLFGISLKTDVVDEKLRTVIQKTEHFERITSDLGRLWKTKVMITRARGCLSDWLATSARHRQPQATPPPAIDPTIETALRSARILSMDVFDTVILRLVRKPADLFLYMQDDVRRLLQAPTLRFADVRVAAESESRLPAAGGDDSGETTLDRIYAVLGAKLGIDPATAARIRDLEIQTEEKLTYPNPEIAALMQKAAAQGKQIVFASDMYLSAAQVKSLLRKTPFAAQPLYLSSELRATKHEGRLFDLLLADLKAQPGEILHVGDNRRSDQERPQTRSIPACHWVRSDASTPLVDQHVSQSAAWQDDWVSSVYAGLARRRRLQKPLTPGHTPALWDMIGYEVIGPLFLSLVSWALQRAAAQNIHRVFYLARDGYQLAKVSAMVAEARGLNIQSEYLFASRRLLNLPRITCFDEESIAFLTTPNPCMRVTDFLGRIGIAADGHDALARQFGFESLHEVITTKDGGWVTQAAGQNLRRFITTFENQILQMAREERDRLLAYFAHKGLSSNEPTAIVDIGWHASSLKSLRDLVRMAGHEPKMLGLYFGTWNMARATVDAGCRLESLFVHLHQPRFRADIATESVELLESLFWAPHATITGIVQKDGQWTASYGEPEIDAQSSEYLRTAVESAFTFVRDALAVLPAANPCPPPYGYLETTLERLLRYPRLEEVNAFGGLALRNSFGGRGPLRHLALVPSPWQIFRNPASLQEAYDQCYWKKGFQAQLTPHQRTLINL
jgi:glycosyltransferase involved in cell wall biosynthesis/FMN phosphatase YigB (HAD superfamily)